MLCCTYETVDTYIHNLTPDAATNRLTCGILGAELLHALAHVQQIAAPLHEALHVREDGRDVKRRPGPLTRPRVCRNRLDGVVVCAPPRLAAANRRCEGGHGARDVPRVFEDVADVDAGHAHARHLVADLRRKY